MDVKVILACQKEGNAKQAYINVLKPLGVQVDTPLLVPVAPGRIRP